MNTMNYTQDNDYQTSVGSNPGLRQIQGTTASHYNSNGVKEHQSLNTFHQQMPLQIQSAQVVNTPHSYSNPPFTQSYSNPVCIQSNSNPTFTQTYTNPIFTQSNSNPTFSQSYFNPTSTQSNSNPTFSQSGVNTTTIQTNQANNFDIQQPNFQPNSNLVTCFQADSGHNYSNLQHSHGNYNQPQSQFHQNFGFVNQQANANGWYQNPDLPHHQQPQPHHGHSTTPRQKDIKICKWLSPNKYGVLVSCQNQYQTAQNLGMHLRADHESTLDKNNLVCMWEGCQKEDNFAQANKLHLHLRVHTGEEPYACSHCGATFKRKENCTIHERTHTKEKPFVCKFQGCDRRFGNSSDRKKHSYCHATAKNYICSACKKKYKHPSSLRNHKCKFHPYLNAKSNKQRRE